MNDLIDRQAAIDEIDKNRRTLLSLGMNEEEYVLFHYGRRVIEELPIIDTVKHGKWIKDGEAYALYKCSACNDLCTVAGWANCIPEEQMYKSFKFCPNCGAQMQM